MNFELSAKDIEVLKGLLCETEAGELFYEDYIKPQIKASEISIKKQ